MQLINFLTLLTSAWVVGIFAAPVQQPAMAAYANMAKDYDFVEVAPANGRQPGDVKVVAYMPKAIVPKVIQAIGNMQPQDAELQKTQPQTQTPKLTTRDQIPALVHQSHDPSLAGQAEAEGHATPETTNPVAKRAEGEGKWSLVKRVPLKLGKLHISFAIVGRHNW